MLTFEISLTFKNRTIKMITSLKLTQTIKICIPRLMQYQKTLFRDPQQVLEIQFVPRIIRFSINDRQSVAGTALINLLMVFHIN